MQRGFIYVFGSLFYALLLCPPAVSAQEEPKKPGESPYGDGLVYGSGGKNDSGMFIGGNLRFGQASSTEDGSSPGLVIMGGVEPGYQMSLGSWSRVEAGLELLSGTASFREKEAGKTTATIVWGALAKIGYGRSLGNTLFGVWRLGAGPVSAKYKAKPEGVTIESDGSLGGVAGYLAFELVMPAGVSLDFTGGVSWTHLQFDIDDVKVDGGGTENVGRPLNINAQQVELGLRIRL